MATEALNAYLSRLAGQRATPAGGAAAALTGAQAAALLAMAARISRKPLASDSDARALLNRLVDQSDRLTGELLGHGDTDCRAFEAVLAASRRTDLPESTRAVVINATLQAAVSVPLKVLDCCVEILRGCASLAPHCRPFLAGDLSAAVRLASTAAEISHTNVRINLRAIEEHAAEIAGSPDPVFAAVVEHGRRFVVTTEAGLRTVAQAYGAAASAAAGAGATLPDLADSAGASMP